MLRHVVMFQFKEEAQGRTKAENIEITRQMLEALPQKIEWIRASQIAVNAPDADEGNYDLVLITDFDSMEDYRRYKVHPDHVAVGTFMRPVRITRSSVDFYVD